VIKRVNIARIPIAANIYQKRVLFKKKIKEKNRKRFQKYIEDIIRQKKIDSISLTHQSHFYLMRPIEPEDGSYNAILDQELKSQDWDPYQSTQIGQSGLKLLPNDCLKYGTIVDVYNW